MLDVVHRFRENSRSLKGAHYHRFLQVFDWLNDFVLFHDFSLTTLLQILRVALTIHLRNLDESIVEGLFNPGQG